MPAFLKNLSRFLGGSAAPEKILQEAGLEIDQASFWQGGFDMLAEMIAELEHSA